MASKQPLDLIEGACLVLISNGISHGYQLAKQFESNTVLGEVLTLTRPVIYRAIKSLETQKLIRSANSLGSRGQLKFKLRCTSDGEKQALTEDVVKTMVNVDEMYANRASDDDLEISNETMAFSHDHSKQTSKLRLSLDEDSDPDS